MAVTGITRSDKTDHVLDSDPAKRRVPLEVPRIENGEKITEEVVIDDDATFFECGVLDLFLMGMIYDQATQVSRAEEDGLLQVNTRLNRTNIDAVRFGLKGWRNFCDAAGDEIPFKTVEKNVDGRKYRAVTDDCLTRIGIRDIQELAGVIKEQSELTKAEAKNFATAS